MEGRAHITCPKHQGVCHPLLGCIANRLGAAWQSRSGVIPGPSPLTYRPFEHANPRSQTSVSLGGSSHCPRVVGTRTVAAQCHSAFAWTNGSGTPGILIRISCGQCVAELVRQTATPPGCKGPWKSCNTPPHRFGAVPRGNLAAQCPTAPGQLVLTLRYTAQLPEGKGEGNLCGTLMQ